MKEELLWEIGYSKDKELIPSEFVKAVVPGAVQIDWAREKQYKNPYEDINFKQFKWMENCYWYYKAKMPTYKLKTGQKLFFVSRGIDYEFDIFIDGKKIFYQEGMFTPVEIDFTEYATEVREVMIRIYPVPKDKTGRPDSPEEARQSVKPAVAYGWDWHPRLIPLGIWDKTYLEIRDFDYIRDAEVTVCLSEDYKQANITFKADVNENSVLVWEFFSPSGEKLFEGNERECTFKIENPQLWWCNGYGEPNLYFWKVKTSSGDSKIGRIGIRRVELAMNEGAWEEPKQFPKTRSNPPITIKLNGVPVFAKGSNWVCPEIFPGMVTKEIYKNLLIYAKNSNMNILRCWGGAYVNKESFFELCDEMGIMIWQEFPLACNDYYDSDHYLEILEQEAISILKRLRKHPSVVLWCGGNELFNNWSKMHEQKLALRLLNKLCYEYDRNTPFIMTSPLMGMAHGNYLFCYDNGQEAFSVMQKCHNTAYTEFGVPSIADLGYLRKYISKEYLEPFEENDVTTAHHAFGAWDQECSTWSCIKIIEDYFGKQENLDKLIEKSQWLQSEGYKGMFEEARRQKPYCSMAINWCFNEPWPTIANNSLLSYPAVPKPAYYAVKDSLKDVVASVQIPKFTYYGNETFVARLWILNDGQKTITGGSVNVFIQIANQKMHVLEWNYGMLEPGKNKKGPEICWILPKLEADYIEVILEAGDLSNRYRLSYKE